jgi:hypothetical protein
LHASIFRNIAASLWAAVHGNMQRAKPPPRIVIEA